MPFSILVVCLGNVCRSPQAERLLRMRLDESLGERKDEVCVASAGVRALVGSAMDPSAGEEVTRLGGSPEGFVSRQMTDQMVADVDLILTATKEIRSRVLEDVPGALRRAFTLREFAGLVDGRSESTPQALVSVAAQNRSGADIADYDIPDPIGGDSEVHELVSAIIDDATRVIAEALTRSLGVTAG